MDDMSRRGLARNRLVLDGVYNKNIQVTRLVPLLVLRLTLYWFLIKKKNNEPSNDAAGDKIGIWNRHGRLCISELKEIVSTSFFGGGFKTTHGRGSSLLTCILR